MVAKVTKSVRQYICPSRCAQRAISIYRAIYLSKNMSYAQLFLTKLKKVSRVETGVSSRPQNSKSTGVAKRFINCNYVKLFLIRPSTPQLKCRWRDSRP